MNAQKDTLLKVIKADPPVQKIRIETHLGINIETHDDNPTMDYLVIMRE